MICLSCNTILTDKEATRTYEHGEHIDLCDDCFLDSGIEECQENYFLDNNVYEEK